jgi:uncharacterized protein
MLSLGLFAMQPHFLEQAAPRPRSRAHLVRAGQPLVCLVCLAAILAAVGPARAQKPETLQYSGYVNDFAGVLSSSAKAQLTALCTEVDQKTQAQIAVVTVKSLGDLTAQQYSFDLATHWGVGPKQKDRGVLIFFAIQDHAYFTQVGYGLEPILPDGKVGGFGREAIPLLRQSNYDAALYLVTRRIADVIAQDRGVTLSGSTIPVRARQRRDTSGFPGIIVLLIVLFVIWLFTHSGPRSGYTRRGGGGWWIGPVIGGGLGGGGWGGGGGFGGGGGGGFGGFGGGGFGGGGAGGSW